MHPRPRRPLVLSGAVGIGALALVLASAVPASAHVTVSSDSAEAGAYTVLAFSVPHGCEGSPTTSVSIQIPEGVTSVTPTRNSFYEVEKVSEALGEPITDSHGNEVTERVAEVVYTATTPLPDDQRDVFELSVRLPDDAAGSTLRFPTVQTCEQGEAAWVQVPADGQSSDDLELPAPEIAVTAPADAAQDAAATGTGDERNAGSGQIPLVIASLVIGALGLIAGVTALVRGHRAP